MRTQRQVRRVAGRVALSRVRRSPRVPLSARLLPSLRRSSRLPRPFPEQRSRRTPPRAPRTIAGAVMSPASPWCTERGGAWNEVGVTTRGGA